MHYITSKCSKCGNILRFRSRVTAKDAEKFGVPYDTCPFCKSLLINGHKEFIMMKPIDRLKYHISSIIYGIVLGPMLGVVLGEILVPTNDSMVMAFMIAGFILLEIIFYWRVEVNFNEQKEKSIERTKNSEYLDKLLALGLISDTQYKDFIKHYKVK